MEIPSAVITGLLVRLERALRGQVVGTGPKTGAARAQQDPGNRVRQAAAVIANHVVELQISHTEAVGHRPGDEVRAAYESWRVVAVGIARVTETIGGRRSVHFICQAEERVNPVR